MHVVEKNGPVRQPEVDARPLKVSGDKRGAQSSAGQHTGIPQWKLSFWTRWDHESGTGHLIAIWCHSEEEARRCFGEYQGMLESHAQIITRVELLAPSGELITTV